MFIKLTRYDGRVAYLRTDLITAIVDFKADKDEARSMVYYQGENTPWYLQETPDNIVRLIEGV